MQNLISRKIDREQVLIARWTVYKNHRPIQCQIVLDTSTPIDSNRMFESVAEALEQYDFEEIRVSLDDVFTTDNGTETNSQLHTFYAPLFTGD